MASNHRPEIDDWTDIGLLLWYVFFCGVAAFVASFWI